MRVPEGNLHCHCILSIFTAGAHKIYANTLALKFFFILMVNLHYTLGCANKDLNGSLGPLGKFIEYCRIVALLPVIPRYNSTIVYGFAQRPQRFAQPTVYTY